MIGVHEIRYSHGLSGDHVRAALIKKLPRSRGSEQGASFQVARRWGLPPRRRTATSYCCRIVPLLVKSFFGSYPESWRFFIYAS